ncbi:MAG: GNAT family N-acetyltransferase [Candidatus Micrarchaeales archaeon]|nr:GNAT family N-acetyltransferase [Candidatus Micrarchaeales archaeon]
MEIHNSEFRLYLKSPEQQDADAIAELANNYNVSKELHNTFPHPYTRADAISFIDFAAASLADGTGLHLAIRIKGEGEVIGMVGLRIFSRNRSAEIGYWLGEKYWSRGYGKEAIRLMLAYGFEKLKLNRIYAGVFSHNERSMHILEKLGFCREGVLREEELKDGKFVNTVYLSILKREYKEKLRIEVKEIR